jgi:hypothetical protein
MRKEKEMTNRMINDAIAAHFILLASASAIISATLATAVSFFGLYSLNPLSVLGAAIVLGLAFGVYTKKSRACAIILLAWHLGARFDMYQSTGSLYAAFGPVPVSIAWIYVLGVLGTVALHGKTKDASSTAADLTPEPTYNETSS